MSPKPSGCRFLPAFVLALMEEVGQGAFEEVLAKAGMPVEWADLARIRTLEGTETATVYAGIQHALRTYYGRGARGTLLRTGRNLWQRLGTEAPLSLRLQSGYVRALPRSARLEPALRLLSSHLASEPGDVTVHRMDPDLVLCDRASPGTLGQSETFPICFATLGMVHACLAWATGLEYDVEETSCRAKGEAVCEFKISSGG